MGDFNILLNKRDPLVTEFIDIHELFKISLSLRSPTQNLGSTLGQILSPINIENDILR